MQNHGLEASLQTSGILLLETVAPYLLARYYIRDASDFVSTIQFFFWVILFLFPFAVIELVSHQNILLQAFGAIAPTFEEAADFRSGLKRVQSVFDHPILFGVAVGSMFALVHAALGYGQSVAQKALKSGIVAMTCFMSLSAGPLLAVIIQVLILTWSSVVASKYKWPLLLGLVASITVLLQLVANRSALDVIAGLVVFDDQSYWYRLVIWDYGTASVQSYPLWGVGKNEWPRPSWMPSSIDNLYLLLAVRHGLPAPLFMLSGLFAIIVAVALRSGDGNKMEAFRTAWLSSMVGLFLVGWTVAFWNATYVLYFFLLGAGVWFLDTGREMSPHAVGPRELMGGRKAGVRRRSDPKGQQEGPGLPNDGRIPGNEGGDVV